MLREAITLMIRFQGWAVDQWCIRFHGVPSTVLLKLRGRKRREMTPAW